MKKTLRYQLTPLAVSIAVIVTPVTSAFAKEGEHRLLEEITVTSRKHEESVMDIPASIQAFSQEDLKNMGARGIADYSRFQPSVTVLDFGAGPAQIVFRGAVSEPNAYLTQATSSVYIDEISVTTFGQQPSIRMVDIERVESLAGPQGTLYGSDAQAGTMRIITNKPIMNETEVTLDGSLRNGSEGEGSYDGSIAINIPLIEDKVSARLVGFSARDGGFIDNVYGRTIDNDTQSGGVPGGWGTLDNADVVEEDINSTDLSGWRLAVRWNINENWTATATRMEQKDKSGSYSAYDPNVGDLETIRFNKEFYDVDYDISSLTVEADLGFAQLVSATSYFNSESAFTQDVTNYQKSYSVYYCYAAPDADSNYYFIPPNEGGAGVYSPHYCTAPTIEGDSLAAFDEFIDTDRFSQEFRLRSQGDTVDWLVGAFYEKSNYTYEEFFGYPTGNAGGRGANLYQESISFAYHEEDAGVALPNARAPFYAKNAADVEQYAIFGETVWHLSDAVDITVGARYFDRENVTTYTEAQPNTNPNGETEILIGDDQEFVPKLSVSYKLNDDSMVYGLWTEGYRPGGANRQRGEPLAPQQYNADKLTNWEAGYKGQLADNTLRINATIFYMDWQDYQFELVEPSNTPCPDDGPGSIAGVCGQPYSVSVLNAGDAHIFGTTFEVDWAVSSRLLVGMNAEWLEAETDTEIDLSSVYLEEGSRLPSTPEWSGAAWATYSFPVEAADATGYVRLQWSYSGSRLNTIEPFPQEDFTRNPQFNNDSYNIGDLSFGLKGDDWEVSVFINNLTDERATYTQESQGGWSQQNLSEGREHVQTLYTNRPREYGIRIIKHWGG